VSNPSGRGRRGEASRPPRRKRFGQHFLHDPAVILKIVQAIHPQPGERLVEIGPGRGALTRRLLEGASWTLDALEIDRDLAGLLRTELAGCKGFVLHQTDALELDFARLASERGVRLRIVGNLPYNISTPLLFHLLANREAITDMHVMLQREVAARIAAQPGDEDYGRLTVMLAPWLASERLFDVGPGAFQPPPRVWSAVLRLTVRAQPAFAVSPRYAVIVTAAFGQRRKTLRNSLGELLSARQIEDCGLDPGARPETLAPQQLNALAQSLDMSTGSPE